MINPEIKSRFARLRARWADPLLTLLTVMLGFFLFVLAPLQAWGLLRSEGYWFALILLCAAALFVVSGSVLTIVAVIGAIGISTIAAVLRVRHSSLALYFDAHLIIGATFAALYLFVGLAVPNAFSGVPMDDSPALTSNLIYFSFVTLTSTGYGEIVPVDPFARSLSNIEGIIGQLYP